MISKKDFRKINDYLFEIPKTFRSDMQVPARVYVSEKMLEESLKDRSLEQLINISTLPGIERYALAMPDIHEGYASPIGGVAAINTKTGIISPGMCGYDINCLPGNSLINLPFGTHLSIESLEKYWRNTSISLINKKHKSIDNSKITGFLSRKEDNFLYVLKTKNGFSLKLTEDHPIYTTEGMKDAKELKTGDRVIVYPFKGVSYEEPENLELVNEDKIKNALVKLGLLNNGNRRAQIIKWFKKNNLIDLNFQSSQMPYLIKLAGYVFGDGSINLGKKHSSITLYGKLEDLEQIQRELKTIGIKTTLFTRKRKCKIKSYYGKTNKFSYTEHSLRSNNVSFVVLLHLLGCPLGNKTYQRFRVPEWLLKTPLWQKRLFLSAFFGAEMSKPDTLNKYNFYSPTLNINKVIPFRKNGISFLGCLKKILKEFGIDSTKTTEVEELGIRNKTIGLRFHILSSPQNLIRFFETIGFECHKEKQRLACLGIAYLRRKEKIIDMRSRIRELVRTLYGQGVPSAELVKAHRSEFVGERFIEHSIWSERGNPRIAFNFTSFDDFMREYSYGKEGFVVDEIEEIKREKYQGLVYDLTVENQNHNFIADNFVVSNCGVRMLTSELKEEDVKGYLESLASEIQREVPSGLGRGRKTKLSIDEIDKVLERGAKRIVEQGYGEEKDLLNCESNGRLEWADANAVSIEAKNRGRDQVGTLGSGNHFTEIQKVEEIFNEEAARHFGLFKNQVVVMVHCGSRGLGHQVCTDYLKTMIPAMDRYKIRVVDREFACVPFNSDEGKRYFSAMAASANFAWANRQMIVNFIRKAWNKVLGDKASKLTAFYDVAHNIIKKERYRINGKEMELAVHRKGATRAFPPHNAEIPISYRDIGQPVLIPGSMGTASHVLVGTQGGEEAFFSTCHGAGRTMSRHEAMRRISGQEVLKMLESKGIVVKCFSVRGIAEEAPLAYKDVNEVVNVVDKANLSSKVARLTPLAVIKGE